MSIASLSPVALSVGRWSPTSTVLVAPPPLLRQGVTTALPSTPSLPLPPPASKVFRFKGWQDFLCQDNLKQAFQIAMIASLLKLVGSVARIMDDKLGFRPTEKESMEREFAEPSFILAASFLFTAAFEANKHVPVTTKKAIEVACLLPIYVASTVLARFVSYQPESYPPALRERVFGKRPINTQQVLARQLDYEEKHRRPLNQLG
ncbi:MAG: hypothetical protein ACKO34_08990 [Vampirovibrionales bacterium]